MSPWERYYVYIFWDYPEIESLAKYLSRDEFRKFIGSLRNNDSIRFNLILRRFLERARLQDLFFFFDCEDIREGIEKFHLWDKLSPVRLHAIRHALEFMKRRAEAVHG